jgi:DNA (cytosine-5)-methyltransferase 1
LKPRRGKRATKAASASHISLFSGAGGLDLGIEKAGFSTLAFVEKDAAARATLVLNREHFSKSEAPVLNDALSTSGKDLLNASGLSVGQLDLLSGGPPCQPFSTAGHRLSIVDPRGSLFGRYLQVVSELRPRFFLLENVRGLLSAALEHRPLARRDAGNKPIRPTEVLGSFLNLVILPEINERLGYEVAYGLVNAADYGVPQARERVVFIASRDHELKSASIMDLMPPTHTSGVAKGRRSHVKLGEALRDLNDDGASMDYSPERKRVFDLIPEGRNWRFIRDEIGDSKLREVMGGAYSSTGGRVGFWRRLSWGKVSPTLPASPVQKATGLCHPSETRPLSVREYARVQQFRDDYAFAGSVAAQYRQIGNAVPVGLAEAMGKAVMAL